VLAGPPLPVATITTLPARTAPAELVTVERQVDPRKLIRQLVTLCLVVLVPCLAAPAVALAVSGRDAAADVSDIAGVPIGALSAFLTLVAVRLMFPLTQVVERHESSGPCIRVRRRGRLRVVGWTLICSSFVAFFFAFRTSGLLTAWHLMPW
jgi:hypothetical protein